MDETIKNPLEGYREKLHSLRHDFLDELPKEMVALSDPNYHRYKCRGNYFQAVVANFENILSGGFITGELADRLHAFIRQVEDRDWKRKTTKQEIDEVNKLLDETIAAIS